MLKKGAVRDRDDRYVMIVTMVTLRYLFGATAGRGWLE